MSLKQELKKEQERLENGLKGYLKQFIGETNELSVNISDIDLTEANIEVVLDTSKQINKNSSRVSKYTFIHDSENNTTVKNLNYTVSTNDGYLTGIDVEESEISFQLMHVIFQVINKFIEDETSTNGDESSEEVTEDKA